MKSLLLAVWQYKQFIFTSIRNDFKVKFARSKLGGLWMILHPLTQILMYALVLSAVLSAKLPGISNRFSYALYLTAGILAWSLFSEMVTRCLTMFLDNANLLKKMVFPKICLPLIITGSALINNLLLLGSILLIFFLFGHYPTGHIIWLPILIIITIGLGLSLGLMLGVLNVFMRDIGQLVPVFLQFGFWFTPIVYMKSIIPEDYRHLLALNPMYHVVSGFQDVLVFQKNPDLLGIGFVALVCVVLLGLALFIFSKASSELVDEL